QRLAYAGSNPRSARIAGRSSAATGDARQPARGLRVSGAPRVRPYAADDVTAVVAMLTEQDPWRRLGYGAARWQRTLTHPLRGREGWVIEESSSPAGIALVRPNFLAGDYLELFAIAGRLHGRGLGASLLDTVERTVLARGRNLFVCVSDFNHTAR